MKDPSSGGPLSSKPFLAAKSTAAQVIGERRHLSDLGRRAYERARDHGGDGGPLDRVLVELKAMIRLVRAYANGEYRDVEAENLILIVAGLIYLVSPIDVVPDFLPAGYFDDAAILAVIGKLVRDETDRFMRWEEDRRQK